MPPFNFNKFKKNAQATIRAWQPGPPGLSLPQPPPQVIEENANAGNNLLAAINLERQTGLPAAAEPFVPAAAAGLNPNAEAFVPEVNTNAGVKLRSYRKSRKTRKARKTRKSRKSRRNYK